MSTGLRRAVRSVFLWALGTSAVTAVVGSLARTLCLPPYWPAGMVMRCRPTGMWPALMRFPPDALITTLLMFVPAVALGAGVHLVVSAVARLERPVVTRLVGALASAGLWVWAAGRMEPSYLDFTVGWYAMAAGAIVGAAVGGWYMPRRTA